MALVILTAHCLVLRGPQDYLVCLRTRTKSLISCSCRCTFIDQSLGFTYVEERHGSESFTGDVRTSGTCFCLSKKHGEIFPVDFTGVNSCLFTAVEKSGLGSRCSSRQVCEGQGVGCIAGTCQCQEGYRALLNGSSCRKDKHNGNGCTKKCKGTGQVCIRGRCLCEQGYTLKGNTCALREYPRYGHSCRSSQMCGGKRVACLNGMCLCRKGYTYKKARSSCEKRSRSVIGQFCKGSSDCTGFHLLCYEKKCTCSPGYHSVSISNTCVRRCTKYDKTMAGYPKLGISRENSKEIEVDVYFNCKDSREACIDACAEEKSFVCKSANFLCKDKDTKCYISKFGYLDVKETERKSEGKDWIFFVRNCIS